MKVSTLCNLYDVTLDLNQLNCGAFAEALEKVREYCGGLVWSEVEETEQPLPKCIKYIDTYHGINVYYDFTTETFLFEEFN